MRLLSTIFSAILMIGILGFKVPGEENKKIFQRIVDIMTMINLLKQESPLFQKIGSKKTFIDFRIYGFIL